MKKIIYLLLGLLIISVLYNVYLYDDVLYYKDLSEFYGELFDKTIVLTEKVVEQRNRIIQEYIGDSFDEDLIDIEMFKKQYEIF